MEELKKLREQIDSIDKQIVSLIEERMEVCIEIGKFKKKNNLAVFDAKREKEVIKNKVALLKNKELSKFIASFYNEMMDTSKRLQSALFESVQPQLEKQNILKFDKVVAYQGREGGNGHEAAKKAFGENANLKKMKTFENVLESINKGESYYGVLPLENSSTGMVNDVLDILVTHNCKIVGEIFLPIEYGLMTKKGNKEIKKVISHPQALKQCSDFIKKNNYQEIFASNTAEAAYIVSQSDDNTLASISNIGAAKIYDLDILQKNIENLPGNTTRFIIVASKDNAVQAGNKMTIRFQLPHLNGSLAEGISKLKEFNLTSIVSRPNLEKKWHYFFYIDMTGNFTKENLKSFEEYANDLEILGVYNE